MRSAQQHQHSYQPNGIVRENKVGYSPVSIWDDTLYVKAYSIGLCSCGDIKKTHVANEDVRTRLEDDRRKK